MELGGLSLWGLCRRLLHSRKIHFSCKDKKVLEISERHKLEFAFLWFFIKDLVQHPRDFRILSAILFIQCGKVETNLKIEINYDKDFNIYHFTLTRTQEKFWIISNFSCLSFNFKYVKNIFGDNNTYFH